MLKQPFSWTDQNIEILKTMIFEGRSASDVGKRLQCSRNAAIGKALRLGMKFGERGKMQRSGTQPMRTAKGIDWTDATLKAAADLWAKGKTAAHIAEILGTSTHSVSSKAGERRDLFPHREKRNHEAARSAASGVAKIINRAKVLDERRERQAAGLPPTAPSYGAYRHAGRMVCDSPPVPFNLVKDSQCKWPLTDLNDPDSADMPCCGANVSFGSYCSHHAGIARGRGSISEQKAIFVGRAR